MNVFTRGTPIFSAAVMTCLRWPITSPGGPDRDGAGSGSSRARDRKALRLRSRRQVGRLAGGQVRDVDVARAGVAAGRPGGPRPAGDLDALEPVGRRPLDDLGEGRVGKRSGQQAELHRATPSPGAPVGSGTVRPSGWATSTQRSCRALSATASRTSIESMAVGERGVWRPFRLAAGHHVGSRWPGRAHRRCRRSPRRGPRAARPRRARPASIRAGLRMRISFGPSRWPNHSWSGCSESQAAAARRSVDLVAERVLAAGADLGDRDRAPGAVLEAEQDRRDVLRLHLAVDGVGRPLRRERLDRTARFVPEGHERCQVGHHRDDALAGDRRHEVQPVRADVADRPERRRPGPARAASSSRSREQPVLEVVAGDEARPGPARRASTTSRRCWFNG